jgi:hypothetical protein
VSESGRSALRLGAVTAVAALLVAVIGALTNRIDTSAFSWDFRYYINVAERGFSVPSASPFAYRYLTPFLARAIAVALDLQTAGGFGALAYGAAVVQLVSIYAFALWYGRSGRGAWFAMLVAAFSLFQVKFLLFDPYRPDHLAYPLILLQTYLALTGRFGPLLISTMIGCQIREFNAIPLVAYLYSGLRMADAAPSESRRRQTSETIIGIAGLAVALLVPRMLIPVAEDFQFVSLTRDGITRAVLAPFVLARDLNFAYTILAYGLPLLMLASPREWFGQWLGLRAQDRRYLGAYTVLVLIFSFLGGTDFFRFATYLLVPQSILLAGLAARATWLHLGLIVAAVFAFNRIWLQVPTHDQDAYLDFYTGYGTRFNSASLMRIAECAALVAVGYLMRRLPQQGSRRDASAGP